MKLAQLLSGRKVADKILQEVKIEVAQLKDRPPCVAFLRVGNDGASISYVQQKETKAAFTGIKSILKVFDAETTTETQLLEEINRLNQDTTIDGILVQAPLPNSMDFVKICNTIHPCKDVDGFGITNLGNLLQDRPGLVPCTPAGIIELLKYYQLPTEGKHVVIVNRSLIVGKPLSALFLQRSAFGNATVTICHSQSHNLQEITQSADILILACGRPEFFDATYIKEGTIIIDVGITRVPSSNERGYTLKGDAHFENVLPIASYITPVPGGVGPMTVAMLMKNTLKAYYLCHHQKHY